MKINELSFNNGFSELPIFDKVGCYSEELE